MLEHAARRELLAAAGEMHDGRRLLRSDEYLCERVLLGEGAGGAGVVSVQMRA